MFITFKQFCVFIACVSFGAVLGVIFNFTLPIKRVVKNKYIKWSIDFLVLVLISFAYIFFNNAFYLPSIRLYMLWGVFIGLFLYYESFYIILAKTDKKIYNIIKKSRGKSVNDGE